MALDLKLFSLKEKICAWEMYEDESKEYLNGGARPFKTSSSMDKIIASEYYDLPYTKKQLKSFDYIGNNADMFERIFNDTSEIRPNARYDNIIKQTFGPDSRIYALYKRKALAPQPIKDSSILYIDFEAMNMRICGWYGELVTPSETFIFEGVAKPFSNDKYVSRLWNNTYSELLPYTLEEICNARHVRFYESYFIDMFRKAKKIYTYGDTDALFVKSSFGNELYDFFKIRNVDCSVRIGRRVLSLEKTCRLFDVNMEGVAHNPKYDVQRMMAYIDKAEKL